MLLHLLHLHAVPIFQQLQIEEALLRADSRNWCVINSHSPPAIVMGISGNLQTLVNQEHLREIPIPVIRRFSGGGTVVIDSQTRFVTFICNRSDTQVESRPDSIFGWSERFYQPVFGDVPFRLRENDYVIGEKKFGGNAQYLCKDRWLHHSSLLWDYQSAMMRYLLMPPKTPSYRNQRSHEDFLCKLKDYYPEHLLIEQRIINQLQADFQIVKIELNDVLPILEKPHRKATEYVECSHASLL